MGTFTVELELEYGKTGLSMTKNIKINGKEPTPPEGEPDTRNMNRLLGQMSPPINLAEGVSAADPCAWIWNPTLGRWFWR